jgi:hypothetical protein
MERKEPATRLEWLHWFWANADVPPSTRRSMRKQFEAETGLVVPQDYRE